MVAYSPLRTLEGPTLINADKPDLWKADVAASVAMYNNWFLAAAPQAYRLSRSSATKQVERALDATNNFADLTADVLRQAPSIINVLRMATAPPLARDRLVGLSNVSKSLVMRLEAGDLPPRMRPDQLRTELESISATIADLLDTELFPWLAENKTPSTDDQQLAAVVVADRLTGAQADPIIRNAQEQRQLAAIEEWLNSHGYSKNVDDRHANQMKPGTYSFRTNIVVRASNTSSTNIPIDVVVQPHRARLPRMPLLIEAKSAGDFTNTNKRRKEEAQKVHQLRATYGMETGLLLFLCGYFDTGYLGYEAAEGIDWVWEHRIDDLSEAGL